jgi:uncharacterized membrane protein
MKYIKNNYNYLLFSFFLVSIFCWFLEIGYSLIIRNKFVLPGAWYGPYCPIYGFTFLLLLVVFKKEDNIIYNILKIAITVTVMEYFISFISGQIFNHDIWDYSNKFLNINGRVCLEMSTLFTVMGTIMMYTLVPVTKKLYDELDGIVKYLNIFFIFILSVDMIVTLV